MLFLLVKLPLWAVVVVIGVLVFPLVFLGVWRERRRWIDHDTM